MQYEKLTQAGMDVDGLLNRLMGNASLIRLFTQKFIQDKTFEKLTAAFAAGDMAAAEMASHTLKGMCGNLSMTELYRQFTEQTNLIRAGEYAKAEEMMPEITVCYQRALDGMNAFLAEK